MRHTHSRVEINWTFAYSRAYCPSLGVVYVANFLELGLCDLLGALWWVIMLWYYMFRYMMSQLFQYFTQNLILVLNRRVPSHWISEIIIINININVEGHEVVDRFIISQTTAECRLSSVRLTMVTACYRYFVVSVTIW